MLKEFKEFAIKGNAIDMAVGIIIGAAFGGIVSSLVKDIIMPPIGVLTGGLDFSNQFIVLKDAPGGASSPPPRKRRRPGHHLELRQFPHPADQFPDRRARRVHARARDQQAEAAEPGTAPVSKDCPYCAMTIPIKATRCPHCTSEMAGVAAKA